MCSFRTAMPMFARPHGLSNPLQKKLHLHRSFSSPIGVRDLRTLAEHPVAKIPIHFTKRSFKPLESLHKSMFLSLLATGATLRRKSRTSDPSSTLLQRSSSPLAITTFRTRDAATISPAVLASELPPVH